MPSYWFLLYNNNFMSKKKKKIKQQQIETRFLMQVKDFGEKHLNSLYSYVVNPTKYLLCKWNRA